MEYSPAQHLIAIFLREIIYIPQSNKPYKIKGGKYVSNPKETGNFPVIV